MAQAQTLQDFLINLGFKVDEASQRRFTDAVSGIAKMMAGLGTALAAAAAAVAHTVAEHAKSAESLYQTVEGINRGGAITATAAGLKDLATAMLQVANVPQSQTYNALAGIGSALKDPSHLSLWRALGAGTEGSESDQLLRLIEHLRSLPRVLQQYQIKQLSDAGLGSAEFYNNALRPGVPEAVAEARKRREAVGLDPDRMAKDADALHVAMTRLHQNMDDVLSKFTAEAMPGLIKGVDNLRKMFDDHLPQVRTWMEAVGKYLEDHPNAQMVAGAAYVAEESGLAGGIWSMIKWVGGGLLFNSLLKRRLAALGKGAGAAAEGAAGAEAGAGAGAAAAAGGGLMATLGGLLTLGGLAWGAHSLLESGSDWLEDKIFGKGHHARVRAIIDGDGAPDGQQQDGPGLITRMWHGFWESIVGTAHAEELPDHIKVLSERVFDLNQSIKDLLDKSAPGLTGGSDAIKEMIRRALGLDGAGVGGSPHLPTKDVPITDMTLSPIIAAFLKILSYPESQGDYYVKNGKSRFTDLSKFPEGIGPGGTSTASGRYQDISSTWHDIEKLFFGGEHNFSTERQDKGNWLWAARWYHNHTMRDLEADLADPQMIGRIVTTLRSQWPSLSAANLEKLHGPGGMMRNPNVVNNSSADRNVTINQTNNSNIRGADAAENARTLREVQNHFNSEMTRQVMGTLH